MINRRRLLVGAGFAATTLAAPAVLRAQPKTVKMGALRLVHSGNLTLATWLAEPTPSVP